MKGKQEKHMLFILFKKAINKVWPNLDERPIFNFIMGYHDYKYNLFLPSYHQKKFYENRRKAF